MGDGRPTTGYGHFATVDAATRGLPQRPLYFPQRTFKSNERRLGSEEVSGRSVETLRSDSARGRP